MESVRHSLDSIGALIYIQATVKTLETIGDQNGARMFIRFVEGYASPEEAIKSLTGNRLFTDEELTLGHCQREANG